MKRIAIFLFTHTVAVLAGFALGIYLLPILTAPAAPSDESVQALQDQAEFSATFVRDLDGSDALHWGDGDVYVGPRGIALRGKIAPGPDYRLYLSPQFVENEKQVLRIKDQMIQVGEVTTFENFLVNFSDAVNLTDYNTVLIWCETFGEFISAAKYR